MESFNRSGFYFLPAESERLKAQPPGIRIVKFLQREFTQMFQSGK